MFSVSDGGILRTLENLDTSEAEDHITEDEEERILLSRQASTSLILNHQNRPRTHLEDLIDSDDTDVDPNYSPYEASSSSSDEEASCRVEKRKKKTTCKKKEKQQQAATKQVVKRRKIVNPTDPVWKQGQFSPDPLCLSQPSYMEDNYMNWDDKQFVEQYVDDEILSQMVDKSNQTYFLKTGKALNLTLIELKVWLGVNFVMSALQLPRIRMYWEKKWKVPLVANNMKRDRYFLLRNSLKVVYDDDIPQTVRQIDRLWKIRPLLDRILQGCMKQPRQQHISIDEMMVPFTGSCNVKQYVAGKPNPEGLKVFVLANPNGIICDFSVYQGKQTFPEEVNEGFWQCESAVLQLTRSLVPGHVIYIDRFFTTVRLAEELLKRGQRCTGTLMKSRVPTNTDLPEDRSFKRNQERGSSAVTVRGDGVMAITKWLDNNSVCVLSTNESTEPICQAKRWSKIQKRYLNIPQPKVINSYNCYMGGVDLGDRIMANCPSRSRTNKWTVRCILHFFDLSISNSWLQIKEVKKTQNIPAKDIPSYRHFKLSYGQFLIENYRVSGEGEDSDAEHTPNVATDRRRSSDPSKEIRLKGNTHLPDITKGFQKRCALDKCTKKSTVFCVKCHVHLCLVAGRNCFMKYHKD